MPEVNAYTIVKYVDDLIINNGKGIRDKISSFIEAHERMGEIVDRETLIYSITEYDALEDKANTHTDDFIVSLNTILQKDLISFQQTFKDLYFGKDIKQRAIFVYDLCSILDATLAVCNELIINIRVKNKLQEHINELKDYALNITVQDKKKNAFNWNSDNVNEIKTLYNSLKNNYLIECSEQTFVKAFTNQKLDTDEYIKWLDRGRSKQVNKQSLIFLLKKLYNSKVEYPGMDENKLIEYIFRDYSGNQIKNIKISKSNTNTTATNGIYGKIKTIVDSL